MFSSITIKATLHSVKIPALLQFRTMKVSVIGASGAIGAPTMMLLKMNPLITKLIGIDKNESIYSLTNDLSQLNFPAKVTGHVAPEGIDEALWGSSLVIQTANCVPISRETTEQDLMEGNAEIIKNLAEIGSSICPDACFLIVTNPINSMVPLFCKVLENHGTLNPNKVFGVCNLSTMRASSYIADWKGLDPRYVKCPVIGGASPSTTVPVLSEATPKIKFTEETLEILTNHIQQGNKIYDLLSPNTSMATAYATATLATSILNGLKGKLQIGDCAYVKSNLCGTKFFASPLILGKAGIERNLGIPKLNPFEEGLLQTCITDLLKEVERGESYIENFSVAAAAEVAAAAAAVEAVDVSVAATASSNSE